MERLRIDYTAIALHSLVYFFIFSIVIFFVNHETPFMPALYIAGSAFLFTSLVVHFASRLYFSKERCLFKNIRGEEFFIKWEDMKLQIREKNAKDKSYFISFGPESFSYLIGKRERKSFFKLVNKYAPVDHPIREILNTYSEEYNYRP